MPEKLSRLPKGKWPEELIVVVWSHNISESRATKFTPFILLFGEEAILQRKSFITLVTKNLISKPSLE